MPQSLTHAALVDLAARWCQRQGCGAVGRELSCAGLAEIPDVIGFRATCSIVIECKVSRADFLADRKKPHRQEGEGVGNYRFFCAPQGVLSVNDLATPRLSSWGLLEVADNHKIIEVLRPLGNAWPGLDPVLSRHDPVMESWFRFWHPSNIASERALLYSLARRA